MKQAALWGLCALPIFFATVVYSQTEGLPTLRLEPLSPGEAAQSEPKTSETVQQPSLTLTLPKTNTISVPTNAPEQSADLASRDQKIKSLENQLGANSAENRRLVEAVQLLDGQRDRLITDLTNAREKISSLEQAQSQLSSDLAAKHSELAAMKQQLASQSSSGALVQVSAASDVPKGEKPAPAVKTSEVMIADVPLSDWSYTATFKNDKSSVSNRNRAFFKGALTRVPAGGCLVAIVASASKEGRQAGHSHTRASLIKDRVANLSKVLRSQLPDRNLVMSNGPMADVASIEIRHVMQSCSDLDDA